MTAVADTSVIIALSRIGLLSVLQSLFGEVLIPEAVRAEALEGRPEAPDSIPIQQALTDGWLRVKTAGPNKIALGALGPGEAEAIALAENIHAEALILDDRAARRAAANRNLPVIGTVGVLLMARRAGIIPMVSPLLKDLAAQGFRISSEVIDDIVLGDTPTHE